MKFSHFITCSLASSVQIIQDPTADFKVTVSAWQFATRIFAGGLAVRGAYLETKRPAHVVSDHCSACPPSDTNILINDIQLSSHTGLVCQAELFDPCLLLKLLVRLN